MKNRIRIALVGALSSSFVLIGIEAAHAGLRIN
ncbi:hypothetical protein BJ968_001872 [Kineococcus aurantiacus]|uniref:Uncharacterized protein n=1 Tax=Kineococcus aurantiacus TaxID=37633 RepID=A0A7Y9DKM2_9ACTN|nr:hypothetical protein [Kineococcus aurantiacus]